MQSVRRTAIPVAVALVVVLAAAWDADPDPLALAERAAAIERAAQAPNGQRVVLGHISRRLGVSSDVLRRQRAETQLGWGDILIANLLAKAARIPFTEVVAAYRDGRRWEDVALRHALDVAALVHEVQWSQNTIEERSEDRAPRVESPSPGASPGRGTPAPAPPVPARPGHGH